MALTQVKTTGLADDAVTGAKIADDTVAEANMANDAISLTELKAGTDGQIITYDASGNPTAVGPGTDGQVLTSTGAGSPPAFESISIPAGTTINNNADNKVITGSGTANTLEGEANLTFDGGTLQQAIDANDEGYTILADGNHRPTIVGDRDATGEHDELLHLVGKWNNTQVGAIDIQAGADTSNKDDGHIIFYTSSSGGSLNNRMKIHNDGTVAVTDGDLKIATDGHGIDFSASGNVGGMTSELLDDYEEGTWTADVYHQGSTNNGGQYTKIGRLVIAHFKLQTLSAAGNANHQSIASLPFTIKNVTASCGVARGYQTYNLTGGPVYEGSPNSTQVYMYTNTGTNINAADIGGKWLQGAIVYITDS